MQVKFPHQKEAVTRTLFISGIITATFIALVIAFLPITDAYKAEPVWAECDGTFVKNDYTTCTLGIMAFIAIAVSNFAYMLHDL